MIFLVGVDCTQTATSTVTLVGILTNILGPYWLAVVGKWPSVPMAYIVLQIVFQTEKLPLFVHLQLLEHMLDLLAPAMLWL